MYTNEINIPQGPFSGNWGCVFTKQLRLVATRWEMTSSFSFWSHLNLIQKSFSFSSTKTSLVFIPIQRSANFCCKRPSTKNVAQNRYVHKQRSMYPNKILFINIGIGFHRIFTCHEIFFIYIFQFQPLKNIKAILSAGSV